MSTPRYAESYLASIESQMMRFKSWLDELNFDFTLIHVGGTSLPGAFTGGDLDLVMCVTKPNITRYGATFANAGFEARHFDFRPKQSLAFYAGPFDLTVHLVTDANEDTFVLNRECLLRQPALLRRYNERKIRLIGKRDTSADEATTFFSNFPVNELNHIERRDEYRQISTKRMLLRAPRLADAESIATYYRRNRVRLTPWEPRRPDVYFETDYWRSRLVSEWQERLGGRAYSMNLMMPNIFGEEVLGRINLTSIAGHPFCSANLGYSLDGRVEGQGLMREALAAFLAQSASWFSLARVQAGTLLNNDRSQSTLKGLGFVDIGIDNDYLEIAGIRQAHRIWRLDPRMIDRQSAR